MSCRVMVIADGAHAVAWVEALRAAGASTGTADSIDDGLTWLQAASWDLVLLDPLLSRRIDADTARLQVHAPCALLLANDSLGVPDIPALPMLVDADAVAQAMGLTRPNGSIAALVRRLGPRADGIIELVRQELDAGFSITPGMDVDALMQACHRHWPSVSMLGLDDLAQLLRVGESGVVDAEWHDHLQVALAHARTVLTAQRTR